MRKTNNFNKHSKIVTILLALFVISTPVIVTYCLVTFQLEKHVSDFVPQWSDGLYNWHQINTFREAGFNGGYYTLNEKNAPSSFFRFYCHGPVFPIIIGTLSLLIGWNFNSILFINLIWLMLSVALFIICLKPDKLQLILLGLFIATFWPIHIYMASTMRQVFFDGGLIIVATLFYVITKSTNISHKHLILLLVSIAILSLLKISNAILFVPLVFIGQKKYRYSFRGSILISLLVLFVFCMITYFIYAPYQFRYSNTLQARFSQSFHEGAIYLILNIKQNMFRLFNYKNNPLWIVLRVQLLLSIFISCFFLWYKQRNKNDVQYWLIILFISVGTLGGTIVLYILDAWRDYRLFAPIVLMIALLFISHKKYILVSLIIIGNIICTPVFLKNYVKLMQNAFPSTQIVESIHTFSDQISPVLAYDKYASAWDNTLLTSSTIAQRREIMGVPPGIGISWFGSPDQLEDIKSKYLLLDTNNYLLLNKKMKLEFLVSTSIGDLYLNNKP